MNNTVNDTTEVAMDGVANTNTTAEQPPLVEEQMVDYVLAHPSYKQLEDKLTVAEQLAHQHWDNFLRTKAEMENFQRRAERDITNAHKYSLEKIALELLSIVDNLERCVESKPVELAEGAATALKDMYVGVELTLKMFVDVLSKFEIRPVNPTIGDSFNHDYHTAMTVREEIGAKPNSIVQVMQKGYMLKDRLLRPALVIVAAKG
jgi:molecular chaperone GrpE